MVVDSGAMNGSLIMVLVEILLTLPRMQTLHHLPHDLQDNVKIAVLSAENLRIAEQA
jgi:hypothetical protein